MVKVKVAGNEKSQKYFMENKSVFAILRDKYKVKKIFYTEIY